MKSNFEILPIFFDIEKLQKATNELFTKMSWKQHIVIDVLGDPNDYDATEKVLKQIKKDLKPYVKGKIYQGFADGVKKFIKKRGGKV